MAFSYSHSRAETAEGQEGAQAAPSLEFDKHLPTIRENGVLAPESLSYDDRIPQVQGSLVAVPGVLDRAGVDAWVFRPASAGQEPDLKDIPDCTGLVAEKWELGKATFRPVRCHSWACPRCGYTRASWLKRQVEQSMKKYGLTRFVTLTLSTKKVSQADSEVWLKESWNRLRLALSRRYPDLEFIWVMEYTKRGQAHLHLLVNTYIPQALLSNLWEQASGGSRIVDIRYVGTTAAARYIAKYVGKEAGRRRLAGVARVNAHLFGTSRGIEFEPYRKKSQGWIVVEGSLAAWRQFLAVQETGTVQVNWHENRDKISVEREPGTNGVGKYIVPGWVRSDVASSERGYQWRKT